MKYQVAYTIKGMIKLNVQPLPPEAPAPEHGYSTGLLAQLRLRGIEVRFPRDDQPGTYVQAYRDEHRAHGDEEVVLLYRVGPEVHGGPPAGYRLVSVAGPGPGEPVNALSVPSAIYLRL